MEKEERKAEENGLMGRARTLSLTIGPDCQGRTIRDILKKNYGLVDHDISRAKYRSDGILLNGRRTYVTTEVAEGDLLTVTVDSPPLGRTVPAKGPIDILYEDEDIIALNKPAGIVVHPSHGHFRDSLGNYLAGYFEETGQVHDVRTIGRLDKDTSGVILYGKTRTAVYLLTKQAEEGELKKTYLALAEGLFPEDHYAFDDPIGRVEEDKIRRMVRPDGQRAHTEAFVERRFPGYALVRCHIETGRTHQIRVHLSHAGHPLLGDPLYGGKPLLPRAALHCALVTFRRPFSGETVTVEAPLPSDMKEWL